MALSGASRLTDHCHCVQTQLSEPVPHPGGILPEQVRFPLERDWSDKARAEQTRLNLMASAAAEIYEKGYHAAALSDILRRAGATKGALMALARGQAMEVAVDGIRVNTVSPGTVDSPMLHNFIKENADDPEAAREAFDELHPIGRVATIEEVAKVFVFLASDDASDITATDIRCDGGYCVQGQQPRN